MSTKRVLQKLLNAEKGNKSPEVISSLCHLIVDDFSSFCKEEEFYSLRFQTIHSAFQRAKGISKEILSLFLSKISLKHQESPLLLNSIDLPHSTLSECASIIRSLRSSPICVHLGDLYEEEQNLVVRDWEYDLKEKDKQIASLKKELKLRPVEKPSDFEPDIHKACEQGKLSSVRFLISQQHEDIEKKGKFGFTPLICASRNGHLEIVQYLVEKGANIEAKERCGSTPLIRASDYGHLETVQYLVEKGANIEAKSNYKNTPLICASYNGHLETVQYLVEKGANIEATNNIGKTAFDWACEKGNRENKKTIQNLVEFKKVKMENK